MDKIKIVAIWVLVLAAVFFLTFPVQAGSISPWFNHKIEVPPEKACNTAEFDGGYKPLTPMYLSVISEEPIWLVIYNGPRYIRENIFARRRTVFNFIPVDNFIVEVCRQNFKSYGAKITQKDAQKDASGTATTNQQKDANSAEANKDKFAVFITSN